MKKASVNTKPISLAIGEIDRLMGEKGISKSELAKKLDVTRSAVSQIFSGKIALSNDHIRIVAPLLEVEFKELHALNGRFVEEETPSRNKTITIPFNTKSGKLVHVPIPEPTGDIYDDGVRMAKFINGLEDGGLIPST